VPNMQIDVFSPKRHPISCAEQKLYTELCASGSECGVPHIPPCVPQPGIQARPRRSAPCQLDERWRCPHRAPGHESCHRSTTTRIRSCSPRAEKKDGMLRRTLSRCHRTKSRPLAHSRGFVRAGRLAGGLDSQERHVAGRTCEEQKLNMFKDGRSLMFSDFRSPS